MGSRGMLEPMLLLLLLLLAGTAQGETEVCGLRTGDCGGWGSENEESGMSGCEVQLAAREGSAKFETGSRPLSAVPKTWTLELTVLGKAFWVKLGLTSTSVSWFPKPVDHSRWRVPGPVWYCPMLLPDDSERAIIG